jgi:hypothetical protein
MEEAYPGGGGEGSVAGGVNRLENSMLVVEASVVLGGWREEMDSLVEVTEAPDMTDCSDMRDSVWLIGRKLGGWGAGVPRDDVLIDMGR